jgi:hypothetical protein
LIGWLFKKRIIESLDDEDSHQDKETFTNEGIAMFDSNPSTDLTADEIGACQ